MKQAILTELTEQELYDLVKNGAKQAAKEVADRVFGERLLDTNEAGAFLGVTRNTVAELAKGGKFKKYQVGKSPRYLMSDLKEYALKKR